MSSNQWERIGGAGLFRRARWLAAAAIAALLLFSPLGTSLAIAPVVDLSQGQQNMVVRGDQTNAYMSELTATADFNKDGYRDLLIGAAGRNSHGPFSGAAYMILGSANPPADLNLTVNQANLTVLGANENDALGHSVAGGDVNGDGYQDMIISSDGANNNRGAVYVFLGGANLAGPTVIDLTNANPKPALMVRGQSPGDRLGRAVSSGDINGDGKDDIIIGAYNASPGGRVEAGAIYVILGRTLSPGTTINLSNTPADLVIYGASGDPDGLNFGAKAPVQGAELLFGDQLRPAAGELGDRLGRTLAVGDVNKDGIQDIIASAYGANVGATIDAGKTYVFYGSAAYNGNPAQTLDLGANPGLANVTLNGVDAGDQSGFFVSHGDLNRDGYADILTSAYISQGAGNSGVQTGEVYVVFGGAALPANLNLASSANITIFGAASGDRLGRSVSSGDINADGTADLILGASRADPGGRTDAGIVYVIYGKNSFPSQILLSNANSADVQILGAGGAGVTCDPEVLPDTDCADETGHSTTAGDINGDGGDDVIAGALFANNGNLQDAGAAYVIFGASSGLGGNKLYMPIINRQ